MIARLGRVLLPSLIVWSVATLQETLVLFASLVALRIVQYLVAADRRRVRVMDGLVGLLAVSLVLLDLRSSMAFVVVGLAGLLLVASRLGLRAWETGLAAVAIAAVLMGGVVVARERANNRPLSAGFEDLALQIRHRRAQEAAGAGSQLRAETDVLSPTGSSLPAAEAISDAAPF